LSLFIYRFFSPFGTWMISLVAAIISAGYFLLLPARTWRCASFYRQVFPDRGWLYAFLCTWRQFQSFARVFSERLELRKEGRIKYTSEGFRHLEEAALAKKGGVIVMSHAGNWEVAARLLRKQGIEMMLFMGVKPQEEVEGRQKEDLRQEELAVVGVEQGSGTRWEMLDALRFLRDGGFVSMTGDRIWSMDRTVTVPFLGRQTSLPDAPYLLAALAGCPVYIFFSFRTAPRTYHISITPPMLLPKTTRRERPGAVLDAATAYADLLGGAVRKHPSQWYHFEPLPLNGGPLTGPSETPR
jgi:lauroyl/myristoyl acyltransferase